MLTEVERECSKLSFSDVKWCEFQLFTILPKISECHGKMVRLF